MLQAAETPRLDDARWLLIDVGNTFLKWGRYQPPEDGVRSAFANCAIHGRVLLAETPILAVEWRAQPCPSFVVISSVAGTRIRNPLMRALEVWPDTPAPLWISAQEEECGIRNEYRNPGQLGSDRWAALIGARGLIGPSPALVVVCGTATTMDLLDGEGRFRGGSIMPGLGLMQRSLHERTAALPDASGDYLKYPRQTVDAIASGCLHAQAGAVERVYQQYRLEYPELLCMVSGGAARMLAPRLQITHRLVDNLVLEGLYSIATHRAAVSPEKA